MCFGVEEAIQRRIELMPIDEEKKWTMRDRALAVMDGQLPDRLPFIDRIEIWYKGMQARGTMPLAYEDMSLEGYFNAIG